MNFKNPSLYKENIKEALLDSSIQRTVEKATDIALNKREKVKKTIQEWIAVSKLAQEIKMHSLSNLQSLLEMFEQQVTSHGGSVFWATDGQEAIRYITSIAQQKGAQLIVKGKSMVSEEIELREALIHSGINCFETDLGEFIVQLEEKPPSHITAPALHLSRQQIGKLFHEKLGVDYYEDPVVLTGIARTFLRERFLKADIGIIGANFLVAETGTIVSIENEGNIRLSSNLPKTVICLVGIEKVIHKFSDLNPFLTLLAPSGTGQRASAYVSFLSGTRLPEETSGPQELHVVLIDNGRSRILHDPELWKALTCIRCGACMNVCPIFRRVGGHAYGSVYPGPIGSLLTPLFKGVETAADLPFGSTLCGRCTEICPVGIPIHELLLAMRRKVIAKRLHPVWERSVMKFLAKVWTTPIVYSSGIKLLEAFYPMSGAFLRKHFLQSWLKTRDLPEPARVSFRTLWKRGELDENNE